MWIVVVLRGIRGLYVVADKGVFRHPVVVSTSMKEDKKHRTDPDGVDTVLNIQENSLLSLPALFALL